MRQQRRLADPGLALQHNNRAGAARRRGDRPLKPLNLSITLQQRNGHILLPVSHPSNRRRSPPRQSTELKAGYARRRSDSRSRSGTSSGGVRSMSRERWNLVVADAARISAPAEVATREPLGFLAPPGW